MGDPVDVGVGFIEAAEGIYVFIGNVADGATGHEIEQIGLIHPLGVGLFLNQPPFLLEAMPESSVG